VGLGRDGMSIQEHAHDGDEEASSTASVMGPAHAHARVCPHPQPAASPVHGPALASTSSTRPATCLTAPSAWCGCFTRRQLLFLCGLRPRRRSCLHALCQHLKCLMRVFHSQAAAVLVRPLPKAPLMPARIVPTPQVPDAGVSLAGSCCSCAASLRSRSRRGSGWSSGAR